MADQVKQSVTVTLKFPVSYGSELFQELEVQRPKVKHLRGIPDTQSTDGQLTLLSRLIGQPPSFLDEVDVADLQHLNDVVNGFLQDSAAG